MPGEEKPADFGGEGEGLAITADPRNWIDLTDKPRPLNTEELKKLTYLVEEVFPKNKKRGGYANWLLASCAAQIRTLKELNEALLEAHKPVSHSRYSKPTNYAVGLTRMLMQRNEEMKRADQAVVKLAGVVEVMQQAKEELDGCGSNAEYADTALRVCDEFHNALSNLPESKKGKMLVDEEELKDLKEIGKDYERIQHDYACVLTHTTQGMSKTNYTLEAVYTEIDDQLQRAVDDEVQEQTETLKSEVKGLKVHAEKSEQYRKAAVHYEEKSEGLQGTIDRLTSDFKAALAGGKP